MMAGMVQHVHVGLLTGLAITSVMVIVGFTSKWAVSKFPTSPAAQGFVAVM